jgi:hypothetical protein|tara:strand:- start:2423 stop:2734 length:312 start_codon:yes stop_codon:yes gene_type:complete
MNKTDNQNKPILGKLAIGGKTYDLENAPKRIIDIVEFVKRLAGQEQEHRFELTKIKLAQQQAARDLSGLVVSEQLQPIEEDSQTTDNNDDDTVVVDEKRNTQH